ncbi:hypothetical protein EI94DRAFT_1333068 [Lactarius quietus]|nr:hypothetical protein EI94DRAFT_1333068 [Lactarius quietus]
MAPPDQVPVHDEAQPGESPRVRTITPSSQTPSNAATTTTDPKGKATEDNPAVSTADPALSPSRAPPQTTYRRPATPPDPAQGPPSEARRNFPAADTLVVVNGVVHTSDVPQSNGSYASDTASHHPASPVSPPGERPPPRRFSDLHT